MKHLGFILFSSLLACVLSCNKGPEFSEIPEIAFLGFSQDTLQWGAEDSTYVTLEIKDGDGNIGGGEAESNVLLYDLRQNVIGPEFKIPKIPASGSKNGIIGEFKFRFETPCCIFPDRDPCKPSVEPFLQEVRYRIIVQDRDGNASNEVFSTPLYVQCMP